METIIGTEEHETGKLRSLPKVSSVVSREAGIWTQPSDSRTHTLSQHTLLQEDENKFYLA